MLTTTTFRESLMAPNCRPLGQDVLTTGWSALRFSLHVVPRGVSPLSIKELPSSDEASRNVTDNRQEETFQMLNLPNRLLQGRRKFLCSAASLTGIAAAPLSVRADTYPSRVVEVIIPFAPGGSSDLSVRPVTDALSEALNGRFVVMNKPGAAGIVGTMQGVRAAPDGYTLVHGYVGNIGINPGLYGPKLTYDPLKDLAVVASLTSLPLFLVVHPSVPAKTIPELVAYAKAHPGELTFGSSGIGGSNHLVGEKFKEVAGIDLRHIPYTGSGKSSIELLGGQISMSFDAGFMVQHIKSGKLRGLAVTSSERIPELPDLPTMSEYYPGFQATSWHGLFAPAATPVELLDRLNSTINQILGRQRTREIMEQSFIYPSPMSRAAYAQYIAEEIKSWNAVIKTSGTTLE